MNVVKGGGYLRYRLSRFDGLFCRFEQGERLFDFTAAAGAGGRRRVGRKDGQGDTLGRRRCGHGRCHRSDHRLHIIQK